MTDADLPKWRSHKVVGAAQITGIGYADVLAVPPAINRLTLTWKIDGRELTRVVLEPDPKLFSRYTPVLGDYYVEYDDGYASLSPQRAFEDGYSRIVADG